MKIPKTHPRYKSLATRERLIRAVERGLAVKEGLIAHGRGEAFDYILDERTSPLAAKAEKAAAAYLLKAKHPVISVNGNAAALAAEQLVKLSAILGADLEANVFYGEREKRIRLIIEELKRYGADKVLGSKADARIPGLKGQRALCSSDGIFSADVVLVPLEDGDRAERLAAMEKRVIAIDLNPLSRTSKAADVSIVDELTRAIPKMIGFARTLKGNNHQIDRTIIGFDNKRNLNGVLAYIAKRLPEL